LKVIGNISFKLIFEQTFPVDSCTQNFTSEVTQGKSNQL